MDKKITGHNIMLAKRQANVRNLGFCAFYKLCTYGKVKCYQSRPSQTFSVMPNAMSDTTNFNIATKNRLHTNSPT